MSRPNGEDTGDEDQFEDTADEEARKVKKDVEREVSPSLRPFESLRNAGGGINEEVKKWGKMLQRRVGRIGEGRKRKVPLSNEQISSMIQFLSSSSISSTDEGVINYVHLFSSFFVPALDGIFDSARSHVFHILSMSASAYECVQDHGKL